MALGLKDVVESAHHAHPDFRVGDRIFATLGYPNAAWGMVVLSPEQQRQFVREYPETFVPAKGKWGEQGSTTVRLEAVDEDALGQALTLARQNAVAKTAAKRTARTRKS